MLRAWLYRIAHNRCVDQLRRPAPIPSEIMPGAQLALSRGDRHDPPAEAERSEDLRRLVADVHSLPEQQRSALLMRELQGLSYEELGCALGISVSGVKSLLLRARGGVVDAAAARDAPCADIRLELASAHDRGVRASGRARRHMRECDQCSSYRGELRSVSRQVAALVPVGPLGHLGLMFGIGGGGAGASAGAGGGIAASGSSALLGGAATVTATKVAAIVCACALVGGAGALQVAAPATHHKQVHVATHATHRAATYVSPPSPEFVAHTAGGAIAPQPSPAPRLLGSADLRTAPTSLSGPTQLALPPTAGGSVDPTGVAQGLSATVPGADPTVVAPPAGSTLPGDPTAASSVPGAAQTAATAGDQTAANPGPGPTGQTPSLGTGQTSTAASGSSASGSSSSSGAQTSSTPQNSASSGSASAVSPATTSSTGAAVTTAAVEPQASVASTQAPDGTTHSGSWSASGTGSGETHAADSIHSLATTRVTGGTYSIGAVMIHWQHRPHAGSSFHRALPQQHYLTASAVH
jgi:DNA-binding CsgD family transcriptional regulator